MDLIYMNSSLQDIGVLHDYELDLAFGADENSFECKVNNNSHCCEAGYYLYIEGTEYGGIIDAIESDTSTGDVTYYGRTWHGILNSKVLCPDAGQSHLVITGEANTVIGVLLSRMGLSDLFVASLDVSGLSIDNYKMDRYITGYDGIIKMLSKVNAKLRFAYKNDHMELSAVPIVDYTQQGGVDSDMIDLTVKKTRNMVNHLICLGQGELENRMVEHLYVDRNGVISQTQTLIGRYEYTGVYENTNAADANELISGGIEKLTELQKQDDLSVDFIEGDDVYDIGDVIGATDNITGISVAVPITKKIVTISNGIMTVEIGTDTTRASTGTTSGGGGGGSSGGSGGGGVTSVNGQVGDVILDSDDVGAYSTTEVDSIIAESLGNIEILLETI